MATKKKRYWEVKRVVVEYYYVDAESREQALREVESPAKVMVMKETATPFKHKDL